MKRLLLFLLLALPALGQSTFYLDPDVSTGTHTGTQTNPWQTLNWTTINSSLATGNVTVYFSACPAGGCGANQTSTAGINIARTNYTAACSSAPCMLTLDGISFWNPSDSSPPASWNANVTPVPCKHGDAGCAWDTASKYQITASLPFGSNATVSNCMGFVTVQGFKFISTGGQIVAGQYLSNFTVQYTEGTANSGASVGPGYFFGPANSGPGNGGIGCAAQPAGGPDNVTEQYNWVHDTFGECTYIGASTPDPVQGATPNQVTEDPGLGNCMPNCHTGANYLIQGEVHESCAIRGGQGDGIDVKDGHVNLLIRNNTIRNNKAAVTPAGNDGQGMVIESATEISGNYIEQVNFSGDTSHDCMALGEGWDTAPGRGVVNIFNNICVNITSGSGHNAGIDFFSPNVGSITVSHLWSSPGIYNNTIFTTTDPAVEVESGVLSGTTATVQNNIFSGSVGGSITGGAQIGTHNHNNFFNSGACPNGETGTVCTDPKFVSTALPGIPNNFKLQSGSPDFGAGVNLTGLGITTLDSDYAGNTRPSSGAWDIGAFQALNVVAAPTLTPGAGSYGAALTGNTAVVISSATGGATICYRTDGVAPTAPTPGTCGAGSTTLSNGSSISVLVSETVKALGTLSGFSNSSVVTAVYLISVPAPTINLTIE